MRTRLLGPTALLLLAVATPLAAQGGNDPTNKVTGSGELPAGWMLRFDPVRTRPGRPTPPTPTPADVSFTKMGTGFHVKSGPAAIYYDTSSTATGEYTVSATFTQPKGMQHEAYGLFVGGADLQDSTQRYLYFVIRPMDGGILISHRTGDARPTALVPWTPDPAVNKEDATTGKATNELAIRVSADSVHFLANGKQVHALAKSQLGEASTDGIAGLRINHNLDLQIEGFGVRK